MKPVEFWKWQFLAIEPGKRAPRRLDWHMTEQEARERYGDAVEPTPGTLEVRMLPESDAERATSYTSLHSQIRNMPR